MVHANNHYAHQSIFHSTYKHTFHTKAYHMVYMSIHFHIITYCIAHAKHSYCTPQYATLHTQNIHIAHHSMLHCTHKTVILHNKAYCIVHAKHSHYMSVYKTQLSFEVCHLCVRFHIVCFDTYEARSAQYVSTANQFCCRHQQNVTFRTLYLQMHTWGPSWSTDAE